MDYATALRYAHAAGMAAGKAHEPTPMHVVERANPFDDSSPVVRQYEPVMGGVCGFAWVCLGDARKGLARAAKQVFGRAYGSSSYYGGAYVWVHHFGQSMERKEAYAHAFARFLRERGFDNVYAQSRMD